MAEGDRKKFSGRKLVSEAGDKSHVDNQSQSQSLSSDKQVDDKQTDGSGVQRLNKAVASTGYCSRRRADELIREGRVRVNGEKISDFSYAVDFSKDSLTVDDQPISKKQFDYLILNKPRGVVTTCDDEFGRENVLELLPAHFSHLKPVGRLDLESEGLLILTNDGELTQKLTHPSKHVLKNYEVTISGKISDVGLDSFRQGMELSDGPTQPAKVRLLERNKDLSRFQIAIAEGRNRQIRRMCAQVGHPIIRLIRVAIGGLQLKGLESGQWRHLTQAEFNAFFQDS
jgi:23S rRNA pseudouridine2605 synthase